MELHKAIELLTDFRKAINIEDEPDLQDAIDLAIEALKYYQETRPQEVSTFCPLLPGETKQ